MQKKRNKKRVLVFGVFDGLHYGHRYFLKQAHTHGTELIAVVTQDAMVEQLKGKKPRYPLAIRISALNMSGTVMTAVPGDGEMNTWSVVKTFQPDVVVFGYDQTALQKAFENDRDLFDWPLEVATVDAYHPDRYHSSLLTKAA